MLGIGGTRRRVAVLTAFAAGLLGTPARAAGVSCHLLEDRPGDGNLQLVSAYAESIGHNVAELDILDGDVASGPRTVVASLRVAGLDDSGDPQTATGVEWGVDWMLGDTRYGVRLLRTREGEVASFYVNGSPTTVLPTIGTDRKRAVITWKVARNQFPALRKHGARFTGISAGTAGYAAARWAADHAASDSAYTDRARSCLGAA